MLGDWVEFKARIQKGLRIHIPVKALWAHKPEAGETFHVRLPVDFQPEDFYAFMGQDVRVPIPKRIATPYLYIGKKLAGNTQKSPCTL